MELEIRRRPRSSAAGRFRLASLVAAAVVATAGTVWPGALAAQVRLFPERDMLPDLLAGTRDPVVKAQLVYSVREPTLYERGFAGDAAVAATLPVLLLARDDGGDDGPGRGVLVLGLEGAVFSRFSFHRVERDLVNTDWVFAVPVVWRRGDHWLRLRYYHTSSHLGDEYGQRFELEPVNFARDGADLTAYLRPRPGLGLYLLGFLTINAHPVRTHGSHVRAGVELEPGGRRPGRPFLAVDLHFETSAHTRPRLASQAGVWLPSPSGRPLRLALELVTGPVPLGQLHGVAGTQLALGLFWNP